jgi:hypothetical protein
MKCVKVLKSDSCMSLLTAGSVASWQTSIVHAEDFYPPTPLSYFYANPAGKGKVYILTEILA